MPRKSSANERLAPAGGSALDEIRAGSFWLVIYEHRPAVITIAPDRSGFFACGQEECWSLREVQAWLRQIKTVERTEAPNDLISCGANKKE